MKRPELHHQAFDHELALLKADERIGRDVGFIRRRPRKIEPLQLLKAFCMLLPGPCPSLRSLAAVLGIVRSQSVSRQAVARRLNGAWVDFLKQMLALFCAGIWSRGMRTRSSRGLAVSCFRTVRYCPFPPSWPGITRAAGTGMTRRLHRQRSRRYPT